MSMLAKMLETEPRHRLLIKVVISTLENNMTLSGKFEKCIYLTTLQLNSCTYRNFCTCALRGKYIDAPAEFCVCECNNFF